MNNHGPQSAPEAPRSRAQLIIMHMPEVLVGRPVEDILYVLKNPANQTLERLAEQLHAGLNNPDASLNLVIAKLEAERKAQDGRALRDGITGGPFGGPR
jgi:hypothetical protein